jgi:ribosomal protein S6--L-glutamate ligase
VLRALGRFPLFETLLKRVAVMKQLLDQGVPVVNHPYTLLLARDKYTSLRLLASRGLPVPKTVVTEDPYEALHLVEQWGKAVIKPLAGTMGLGSFMVSDVDTAYRVLELIASLRQPIYVQEYVEKKGNRDIRVFVVGDMVVAAAYRIARPGTWKTNVAQGARTEPAKIPPEVEELAIKAARALGLCYAGVDIAETSEGSYVIFEVNASPLWRGLYGATGVDPSDYIVSFLEELILGSRDYSACGLPLSW